MAAPADSLGKFTFVAVPFAFPTAWPGIGTNNPVERNRISKEPSFNVWIGSGYGTRWEHRLINTLTDLLASKVKTLAICISGHNENIRNINSDLLAPDDFLKGLQFRQHLAVTAQRRSMSDQYFPADLS
jgi:hypothetical protein